MSWLAEQPHLSVVVNSTFTAPPSLLFCVNVAEERTPAVQEYSDSDIQSALDEIQGKSAIEEMGELADLNRVLQNFGNVSAGNSEARPSTPPTPTTEQLDE